MRAADGPAWRWQRAKAFAAAGRTPDPIDDAMTVAAWRFLRGAGLINHHRQRTDRAIAKAVAIHAEDSTARWELEARLLTGANFEEIPHKLKVTAKVVTA